MPSSSRRARSLACAALLLAGVGTARAQRQPQGFAVERFYPSAPGGGWLVMDDLDISGGWGGAVSFSTGYAHDPLRIAGADGSQHLSLVEHQAFAAVGAAVTWRRFRLYVDMSSPLVVRGDSGTIDGYEFPPGRNPSTQQDCGRLRVCADPGWNPDTIADPRLGFDVRIVGDPKGRFRLGAGAQLIVPSGVRGDYLSDGTVRAMLRVLFAGDVGRFTYAGQVGVHIRPLDDAPAPGSPQGSELLFGVAGGAKLPAGPRSLFVVGAEVFGATAFRSFFGSDTTGLEALLSGRFERTAEHGPNLRVKLGAGAGIPARFGAPEWRLVLAVEAYGRTP